MSKNLSLDFINANKDKTEIDNLLDQLLLGKAESVRINNMISSTFTDLYEVEEVTDFNGWQCDWWSNLFYKGKSFPVFGCAWEGYVEISRNEDESFNDGKEPGEEVSEYEDALKIDVYHDTDIIIRGRERHDILPVKDGVSIEEAEKMVTEGKLNKYYVWRTTTDKYTLMYAPNEGSARSRILAIWGDFNDIANQKGYNKKCEYYKKAVIGSERIEFSGTYYVLDHECVVTLSEEETKNYIKEIADPFNNGKMTADELKNAIKNWNIKNGYDGKIVHLDDKTSKKYIEERRLKNEGK